MHWLAIYALGIGTAAVAKAAGPAIGRAARPAVRAAIKGGLVLTAEAQRLAEEATAELGDLKAEARDELEDGRERTKREDAGRERAARPARESAS